MPLAQDTQNIVDVITINNLANLASATPTIIIPLGLANYYFTSIENNFSTNLGLPTDIGQIVKSALNNNIRVINS